MRWKREQKEKTDNPQQAAQRPTSDTTVSTTTDRSTTSNQQQPTYNHNKALGYPSCAGATCGVERLRALRKTGSDPVL